MSNSLDHLFIAEIKRRLVVENQERILKCLDILSEEDIWHRPNEHSNSVGNLVLHLCGNVTQWLFSTMGGEKDNRQRQAEFDERRPIARQVLKEKIIHLMKRADTILNNLTPTQLSQVYDVQGFRETGVGILLHITEHFSYHVGQITYFVKAKNDMDVGYYSDQDLNKTS
ncbi:MAG: DUF1572 family protein [Saprospiraceae bacterium]|nr:DUF1572 family protein [Saprospiraceae bacterium]